MQCVVATAQLVVGNLNHVLSLAYEVEVGLVFGYVNVLFVCPGLDEYEPGRYPVGRCRVDGCLHCGVVSRAVLRHYGVIYARFGLLPVHRAERYFHALKGVSAAVLDGSGRQCEGVLG